MIHAKPPFHDFTNWLIFGVQVQANLAFQQCTFDFVSNEPFRDFDRSLPEDSKVMGAYLLLLRTCLAGYPQKSATLKSFSLIETQCAQLFESIYSLRNYRTLSRPQVALHAAAAEESFVKIMRDIQHLRSQIDLRETVHPIPMYAPDSGHPDYWILRMDKGLADALEHFRNLKPNESSPSA